jgi:hypothetical protein
MALQLGTFGAWFNPVYDDSARVKFVVESEALGYTTAWLGMGRRAATDLSLVEQALAGCGNTPIPVELGSSGRVG